MSLCDMKFYSLITILFLSLVYLVHSEPQFNYRETIGTDFGPEDWDRVGCDVVGECPGWPDGWELGVGWRLTRNKCEWCPETGNECGIHRQSPINLLREDSTTGHDPECYDYHWMAYQDRSCRWHDIVKNPYTPEENQFKIRRHSLQILQPIDDDGNLQCRGESGQSTFPRLDYSKGFPQWWHLSHTEITVPSEHTQEGKRYDAEVHLAHFYEIAHERKMGKVAIFMEADENVSRWPFLDKLICQWREVEEKNRDECGLESVPPYPGCRNPDRQTGETLFPYEDPYPFVDCDSVENSFRMCKPTSCCESERSTTDYCENEVYGRYGDDVVGSICWWCCPGKLLARADAPPMTPAPSLRATSKSPSKSPTKSPTPNPSATPTVNPTNTGTSMSQPTAQPSQPLTSPPTAATSPPTTSAPVATPTQNEGPTFSPAVCLQLESNAEFNLGRVCKDNSCCSSPRSSTDHCHSVYKMLGEDVDDVCSTCCDPPKEVGPPPPQHPIYPWIDCTTIENPFRMCKPNSCCSSLSPDPGFCTDAFDTYGESMKSICWYCCGEPKDIDPMSPTSTQGPVPTSPPTELEDTKSPTAVPSPSPTMSTSVVQPTSVPTSSPPTKSPTFSPTQGSTGGDSIVCSDYNDNAMINMNRICKAGGCCETLRSSTDQCHFAYEFFGDSMDSVCSDCCSKQLAPPPPVNPDFPPIACTLVDNPFRICKPTSCCESEASDSAYCQEVYATYGEMMGSVCWYCCSEPKEVDESILTLGRKLETNNTSLSHEVDTELRHDIFLPHGMYASELYMEPENFDVAENLEKEYIEGLNEYRQLRKQEELDMKDRKLSETTSGDNYVNVRYSPYEWMREVKTEYYFRYEGGQMVPPCFETVHYRVMKDPIRIHPDQLAELERLLAWRIAPKGSENECQRDTAGREREGSNGNAVDLNRPLQSYSNIHRKVFCECDDWDSKFAEDIAWCSNKDESSRWYDTPYNFDSKGEF